MAMEGTNKLIVISFIGPSGVGKTTALNALGNRYNVLKEKYMELNIHGLDNRLMLSKWNYINNWFNEILKYRESGINTLLTDRSPIDPCAYVRNDSKSLLRTILTSYDEMSEMEIYIKKIYVTCDFEVLQERVTKRLENETQRLKYNEDKREHNLRAFEFYENNREYWDDSIDTTKLDEEETVAAFESIISVML